MPTVHDPIFDVPPRPLFRWGAGPFRLRGIVYRESMERATRLLDKRGTSVSELLRVHGDAALETFLRQPFASLDWYDIGPAIHFAPLLARACGISLLQHMRDSALMHAQAAMKGFTPVILKLVSNETVATWLPRMSTWYHDFGEIETRVAGPRDVRGVRTGVPVFVVQSWAVLSMEFVEHVLELTGAKDVRAHALETELEGTQEGCPLYRVSFQVTWG
jgi:hypothetical protein